MALNGEVKKVSRVGMAAYLHGRPTRIDGRGSLVRLLSDPRLFNFVIMSLYAINAGRWAVEGKWADCCYWLSALGITATVTFGYSH